MRSATVCGMLDEVGDAVDDAGDDDLVVVEREIAQHLVFMRMARIGERQHEAADIQLAQDRHDLVQFHVAVMRAFIVSPADMQADAVARDIDERLLMVATTRSTKPRKSPSGLSW